MVMYVFELMRERAKELRATAKKLDEYADRTEKIWDDYLTVKVQLTKQ